MIRAAALYFSLVFTAGFVLGTLRELVLKPHLHDTMAELLEMPVMIVVIYFSAGFIVRRYRPTGSAALAAGVLAVLLLLAAESCLVVAIRDTTPWDYYLSRPAAPVFAYGASLVFMALAPRWHHRRNSTP